MICGLRREILPTFYRAALWLEKKCDGLILYSKTYSIRKDNSSKHINSEVTRDEFLNFAHHTVFQKNTKFRKVDLFPPSNERAERLLRWVRQIEPVSITGNICQYYYINNITVTNDRKRSETRANIPFHSLRLKHRNPSSKKEYAIREKKKNE
jgi:hypothetical protein